MVLADGEALVIELVAPALPKFELLAGGSVVGALGGGAGGVEIVAGAGGIGLPLPPGTALPAPLGTGACGTPAIAGAWAMSLLPKLLKMTATTTINTTTKAPPPRPIQSQGGCWAAA